MIFDAPTIADIEKVRLWRNSSLPSLRTPFLLTEEMQRDFYHKVICDRQANSRFWAVKDNDKFIALTGFVGIEWENRLAEISIILDPEERRKGLGVVIIDRLLKKGFKELNLDNIYGECYLSNPAVKFWEKIIKEYSAQAVELPNRKFWNGRYWDSLYFNFERDRFYA